MGLIVHDPRTLAVLLDVRHPLAYLALGPAIEFGRNHDVVVDLLPMVDSPLKAPSEPSPADDRGILHRRSRAQAIAREIEIYSKAQGLMLREYYRCPDPTAFHVAWLFLRERAHSVLEAFLDVGFRKYWALEFDPSSREDVEALVVSVLDASRADALLSDFRSWRDDQGGATHDALSEELAGRGLMRGPCYVLEDEVFVGRQHLPMIEWIVGGRSGPGPI